jgi:hypothetical protein
VENVQMDNVDESSKAMDLLVNLPEFSGELAMVVAKDVVSTSHLRMAVALIRRLLQHFVTDGPSRCISQSALAVLFRTVLQLYMIPKDSMVGKPTALMAAEAYVGKACDWSHVVSQDDFDSIGDPPALESTLCTGWRQFGLQFAGHGLVIDTMMSVR